ncbi:hypothetical protein CBR_g2893 [Chara braunii]|uniref:Right handed beta helix domain-containing protein n=1 Tax=Chara braunii TaxID=69332 RepID=A0A388KE73_CHABU|nr:hypothetical protein CBR_g2893 [Chara braunii]|eukprot:GBG68349.1 hypothetical protein CBR_g2893 [Chara braunii]
MARQRLAAPAHGFAMLVAVQVAMVAALLALGYGSEMASARRVTAEQGLAAAINSTAKATRPVVVTITEDIVLTGSLPLILGPIVIKGACGGRKCVIDGAGKYGIFQAYAAPPQCSVTIENLILRNAAEGAVYSKCDLKLTRVHFAKNKGSSAAAVGNGLAKWHIEDCLFEKNSASGAGGALYVSAAGRGRLVRTTFRSNRAGQDGGAVYIFGQVANAYVLDRVTLDSNTAGKSGGGLFVVGTASGAPKVFVSGCKFTKNVAAGGPGGALALSYLLDARICHTSIAGGRNSAKDGQGNDLALLDGNYFPQMTVSFCPANPNSLSLFVTPVPRLPIVRQNCAVCALPR